MAENHELRVKIDAAAAQRGSREFVAAVNAIKTAVRGLERDSSGVFKKLQANIKAASETGKIKVSGIDKRSLTSLDSYVTKHQAMVRELSKTRKETTTLASAVKRLGASYSATAGDAAKYATAIQAGNTALQRQVELAQRLRVALNRVPTTPRTGAPAAPANPAGGGRVTETLSREEALRNRITRAIDNQRAATVALMAQLARVGGTGEISKLEGSFQRFQRELASSTVSAKQFDDAQTALNHSQKSSRVALTRLNAQISEQRRELTVAASAAKEQAAAFREMSRAAKEAAAATSAAGRETQRLESLELATAKAMRSAATQAQLLGERMHNIGNTSNFARLESANQRLNKALSGGVRTTGELKRAVAEYEAELHGLNMALIREEGAHRRNAAAVSRHAAAQRQLVSEARAVEREMRSQAGASHATSRAFHDLTGNMRGLENAFQATYHAGSLFRTMLGGITFGTFISSVYKAGTALEQFRVTMEIATGSAAGAAEQLDFINDLGTQFGTDLRTAREDFSKFAVASELAGVSMDQTQKIFKSVSMAMSVMGRSSEDQRLAFLALEQMMSKNTVSSEELRRQLGERLPGAVSLMAKAVGVTTAELQDMLKAGELVSSEVLPKFADEVNKAFGPGMEAATTRASRNLGTLRNEFELFLAEIADSGFMDVLSKEFAELTKMLRSDDIAKFAQTLGTRLANMAEVGSDALQYLGENLDTVRKYASALITAFLGFKLANFVNFVGLGVQQLLALSASMFRSQTATDATVLSTNLYSQSLYRNGAAAAANAASQQGLITALSGVRAAQTSASLSNAVVASGMVDVGKKGAQTTGKLMKLAGSFGTVARVGSTLLGPLGLLAAGIATLAFDFDIFSALSSETSEMEGEVEGALRRSGALFKDFSDTVEESANRIQHAQNIADFGSVAVDGIDAIIAQRRTEIEGIDVLIKTLNNQSLDIAWWQVFTDADDFLSGIGMSEEAINSLSSSTRTLSKNLNESLNLVRDGEKSAASFMQEVSRAVIQNPGASKVIAPFAAIGGDLENVQKSERMLGDEILSKKGDAETTTLMNLSKQGRAVLESGKGLADFGRQVRQAKIETPELAAELDRLLAIFREFQASGGTGEDFLGRAQSDVYGKELATLRQAQADLSAAQDEIDEARTQFQAQSEKLTEKYLSEVALPADFIEQLENFKTLQSDVALSTEQLDTAWANLTPPTGVESYTQSIREQFGLLDKSDQTYARLSNSLREQAIVYGHTKGEAAAFVETLIEAAREQVDATRTAGDLKAVLDDLGYPTEDISAAAHALLNNAQAMEENRDRADEAGDRVAAAGAAMYNAGLDASDAAAGLSAFAAALASISGGAAVIPDIMGGFRAEIRQREKMATMSARELAVNKATQERLKPLDAKIQQARTSVGQLQGAANDRASAELQNLMQRRNDMAETIATEEGRLLAIEEAASRRRSEESRSARSSGKSGGKGKGKGKGGDKGKEYKTRAEMEKELASLARLTEAHDEYMLSIEAENQALGLLATGQAKTMDHAKMLAEAMLYGSDATVEQVRSFIDLQEEAQKLNQVLKDLAYDPVQEWVDSVPSWERGVKDIEASAIGGLRDSLSSLFRGDGLDAASLFDGIATAAADLLADHAVKALMGMLNGEGSGQGTIVSATQAGAGQQEAAAISSGMIGAGHTVGQIIGGAITGASQSLATSMQAGGHRAGAQIATQQTAAGAQNAVQVQTSMTAAGQGHATTVGTAITTAGAQHAAGVAQAAGGIGQAMSSMGFNPLSLISLGVGLFREGGLSGAPVSRTRVPMSAFASVPHYAEGTANTSGGMPAMLHDNEAVVPLSRGRKIPVDMRGVPSGGAVTSYTFGDINVNVDGGGNGSDDAENAAKIGEAVRVSLEAMVDRKIAEQAQYGGALNPRGYNG